MMIDTVAYKFHVYGLSDLGRVRQANEDVWSEVVAANFFVLADGMGGHQAGDVAARETVERMCAQYRLLAYKGEATHSLAPDQLLKQLIEEVNREVYDLSCSSASLKGMGTTLCCLKFWKDQVAFAHVGDSRIYRFRDLALQPLTKDHSLVRELCDLGDIDPKEANQFSFKNVVTRAIGTHPFVTPCVESSQVDLGDIYLMCSDGLTDAIEDEEIATMLAKAPKIQKAGQALVDLANERGGHDNVTVVLVEVRSNGY